MSINNRGNEWHNIRCEGILIDKLGLFFFSLATYKTFTYNPDLFTDIGLLLCGTTNTET